MIVNVGGSHHVYHAGQFIAGPIDAEALEAFLASPRYLQRIQDLDEEDEEASSRVVAIVAAGGGSASRGISDDQGFLTDDEGFLTDDQT